MSSARCGPPRARLTLRVGVTGHRFDKLSGAALAALRQSVRIELERICRIACDIAADARELYTDEPPRLRLISALAEGADRVVAEEALATAYPMQTGGAEHQALTFELQAALPFGVATYAEDFADTASHSYREATASDPYWRGAPPTSLHEFHWLLEQSTAIAELDGSRSNPESAYEAVGKVIVSQSDVLIAVWDGKTGDGRGGTEQVVRLALRATLPVIWIDAVDPGRVRLLLEQGADAVERNPVGPAPEDGVQPAERPPLDALAPRLRRALLPADGLAPGEAELRLLTPQHYFQEVAPCFSRWLPWRWVGVWSLLQELVTARRAVPPWCSSVPSDADIEQRWSVYNVATTSWTRAIDDLIRSHYAWADQLGTYYANRYRSAFVTNYVLGVVAVILGLIEVPPESHHGAQLQVAKIAVSFTLIATIVVNTYLGTRFRWHERWMDYRLLTELLRHLRYLAILGRVPALSRLPAQNAYGDPRSSWMAWHVRAIARDVGLVPVAFTPTYMESYRVCVREGLIRDQIVYHLTNADRLRGLDVALRWLGRAGFVAVALTLPVVLVYLLRTDQPWPESKIAWLPLLEAGVPAVGGALAAIRGQAELERLVKRSHAMARQLTATLNDLDEMDMSLATLVARVEVAANTMVSEVLDWRLVALDRPLDLPG